uniref:Uncharacterized protein n=1 Tax=Helianthus annuus TaxID=4232 RepID=A0A251U836_HELAN
MGGLGNSQNRPRFKRIILEMVIVSHIGWIGPAYYWKHNENLIILLTVNIVLIKEQLPNVKLSNDKLCYYRFGELTTERKTPGECLNFITSLFPTIKKILSNMNYCYFIIIIFN